MEAQIPQTRPGPNGTPGHFPSPSPTAAAAAGYSVAASPSSTNRLVGIILRGLAVLLTLVATIIMGAAKQSRTLEQTDDYGATFYTGKFTFKSTIFSAYSYFIAANAVAFFLSTVSFVLTITNRPFTTTGAGNNSANVLLSVVEVVTVSLLFSCNGAATAIQSVARHGVNKIGWGKFCDVSKHFCAEVNAAIVLSMFAALVHVVLHLLSIIGSQNKS